MIDARYFMVLLIVILIICTVYGQYDVNENDNFIDIDDNAEIHIDNELYQKMLDAVTYYSLMTDNHDEKLVLIYLATFHLFDMNYSYLSVAKLDDSLTQYPFTPNHIEYPSGNMHHNLQKAIITNITQHLSSSERVFTTNHDNDRPIIDIYLKSLFRDIKVM